MSSPKKTLLNEVQVRKFMKLANLEPLSRGFVHGLTESPVTGRRPEAELEETHGSGVGDRGTGAAGSDSIARRTRGTVTEIDQYRDDEGDWDTEEAEHDLGDAEEDLGDAEEDFGDAGLELGSEDAGGRMVSVDDFLGALESALEDALGDEVEVDASEMDVEDEEGPDDFAPEGDEVVAMDMEDEEEALEESAFRDPPSAGGAQNSHKGSKQHPDHRRKKLAADGLAGKGGPGLVKEEDLEEGDETTSTRRPDGSLKSVTYGEKDADTFHASSSGPGFSTADSLGVTKKGKKAIADNTAGKTNESMDDLVERVTKRVAARILKSALKK
jgi:hypothetical protein